VSKLLFEDNGVVWSLFKVCESYSEAHIYFNEHLLKEHPTPLNVGTTDSFPSFPEGSSLSPPVPPEEKRSDIFKSIMLDLGGHSVIGDHSMGK
jgi:hypothetical protein